MGWKTINGHRYYYKSERDGGRVRTVYFGGGGSGSLMALLQRRIGRNERTSGKNVRPTGRNPKRRNGLLRNGSMTSRPWPMPRWQRPGFTSIGANGGGNGNERANGNQGGQADLYRSGYR